MNNLFKKIAVAAVGFAMAIGVGVAVGSNTGVREARAEDVTFTVNVETGSTSLSKGGVEVSTTSGTFSRTDNYRVYANNSMTISCDSNITKVVFTITQNTFTASLGTWTDSSKTWTGTATSITFSASGGQVRFTSFTVTIDSGTSYNLTYNPGTQGSLTGSSNVKSVVGGSNHTVLSPSDVGISVNTTSYPTYVFDTWKYNSDPYAPGSTFVMPSSAATLTAQWVQGVGLIYNGNGATEGSTATTYVKSGGTQVVSACGFTAPEGKHFSHWYTNSSGTSGTAYDPNDEITNYTSAITLYAIWVDRTDVTFAYPNGSGTTNMTGSNDAATLGANASDWSAVASKNGSNNFPGLNNNGYVALYGENQNYIVFKTLAATGTRYLTSVAITVTTSSYYHFNVYNGEANFEGSAITPTSSSNTYTYTLGNDQTAFTVRNNNGTQSRITSIVVNYRNVAITTPTIILSNTPTSIGIGAGHAVDFTVNYFALTEGHPFSVSTDSTYVTASYTGAYGTGEASVTLTGVKKVNSTTITVSADGATTQTFDIQVEELPIFEDDLGNMSWTASNPSEQAAYAKSPWTLTMNSKYNFVVSTGQGGFIGTNQNNTSIAQVANADWKLKNTSIDAAIVGDATASWSTYGYALYMTNFGVVNPTYFGISVGATNASESATKNIYILASEDAGDTWSVLVSTTLSTTEEMKWEDDDYASSDKAIQFAMVYTSSAYNTISEITVRAYGESLSITKVLDSIYVDDSTKAKTSYTVGESFDIGSAKVYAHYTNPSEYPDEDVTSQVSYSEIIHGTTSVTISYLTKTTTINVSVSDIGDIYKKVTSANELLDGSKVVIGNLGATFLMGVQTTNNRKSESSEPFGYYSSGDVETYSINTAVFTVGILVENDQTYYTFMDSGNNYLYAPAGSSNHLKSHTTLYDSGKWSVSFGENGIATVTTTVNYEAENHTKYMGPNNISVTDNFGAYESSKTLAIYIDVTYNVQLFVDNYMEMTNDDYDTEEYVGLCDAEDGEGNTPYSLAKEALLALGSDYISEFQGNSTFNDAQARYEKWARANHDNSPYAVTSGNGRINILGGGDTAMNSVAVAIISVTSLVAIGGYFFLRKKKTF